MKKILTGMLILFVGASLQSQQPKRQYPDSLKSDSVAFQKENETLKVDSVQFYKAKLDSGNVEIKKSVDRTYKKLERINQLVDNAVLKMQYRNRPRVDVAPIGATVPEFQLPEPILDTNLAERQVAKTKFLWIFRRKN